MHINQRAKPQRPECHYNIEPPLESNGSEIYYYPCFLLGILMGLYHWRFILTLNFRELKSSAQSYGCPLRASVQPSQPLRPEGMCKISNIWGLKQWEKRQQQQCPYWLPSPTPHRSWRPAFRSLRALRGNLSEPKQFWKAW